ncbi:PaaX family transcriptional regulator C-terminal domain-containing protein [Arthrobacter sp. NA-172]|uniref:PaaX family transcriptional regulator n=1 Tax=Arthrobacter sp. NA-172 TaxID=3367524 RepID=UPI0037553CD9
MTPVTASSAPGLVPGAAVDFPRPLKGSSTQHLLITMLGDFWQNTDDWIPAKLITALAASLGVSPSACATGLSRLASRGVLEQSSAGRTSRYRFTKLARVRLRIGFEQVRSFGGQTSPWDGSWTVIAFSVPETSREIRDLFRSRLRWRGFAPLYGALWVSPRDHAEELEENCASFGVEDYVIFRTSDQSLRGKSLIAAWSPEELSEQYEPFIETYGPWLEKADAGLVTAADAFRIRTMAMDAWRAFPWNDPDLPAELLPEKWPLAEARKIFVRLYDGLAASALGHVGAIVEDAAPSLRATASCLPIEAGR